MAEEKENERSQDATDSVGDSSKNEAPTVVCDVVKGLDANQYATKKTVAQGMLDVALLTSNASQLKYVLQVGPQHEFYTLLVVLISISIVLQLLVGLLFVVIGGLDLNDNEDQPSALVLNDVITMFIFVISTINLVISGFGLEYSSNPLVLERLNNIHSEYRMKLNVSAGLLAQIISLMEEHQRYKKLANWLYRVSVAMMTIVMFCDAIRMTFGLDPALSVQDSVLSAIVAVVLSCVFNINHLHHQRKAEILNNTSLAFKAMSITVNIIISIFYSVELDRKLT